MELLEYGISELEHNIEYILNCQPSTIDELTELTFKLANCNGSLTFNRQRAFDEIFKNYTLNEIFKILSKKDICMYNSAELIDEEKMHIILCEVEFREYMENQISNFININDSRDAILAVIVELINDGLIDVEIKDFPKLREIEETYF